MNELVCYFRPAKLEPVLERLNGLTGLCALTFGEARGYGRQKEHLMAYEEDGFRYSFLPRTRLSFAIPDHTLEEAIERIQSACRSGHIGDGKILVRRLSPLTPS